MKTGIVSPFAKLQLPATISKYQNLVLYWYVYTIWFSTPNSGSSTENTSKSSASII